MGVDIRAAAAQGGQPGFFASLPVGTIVAQADGVGLYFDVNVRGSSVLEHVCRGLAHEPPGALSEFCGHLFNGAGECNTDARRLEQLAGTCELRVERGTAVAVDDGAHIRHGDFGEALDFFQLLVETWVAAADECAG